LALIIIISPIYYHTANNKLIIYNNSALFTNQTKTTNFNQNCFCRSRAFETWPQNRTHYNWSQKLELIFGVSNIGTGFKNQCTCLHPKSMDFLPTHVICFNYWNILKPPQWFTCSAVILIKTDCSKMCKCWYPWLLKCYSGRLRMKILVKLCILYCVVFSERCARFWGANDDRDFTAAKQLRENESEIDGYW